MATEPSEAEVEAFYLAQQDRVQRGVQVGYDPASRKGAADAPVRLVEFLDFECPYCRAVEEASRGVVAKYGDRVSLAYRDFPLNNIHPRAQLAAEASRCAAEHTPGFFINGIYLDGAQPASTFERIIGDELAPRRRRSQ